MTVGTQKSRIVVITGASRGIGAACAEEFSKAGDTVVLLARSRAAIEDLAQQVGGTAIACDVSDRAAVDAAIAQVIQAHGRVDVLINNAAVLEPIALLADADPDAWDRLIDINVKGVYYGCRAVLPGMIAQGGGTILTVSSGAAHQAYEGWSAYCASKAAAAQITRSLHEEYASTGIRAMGLSPGTVATQMQRDIKASGVGPVAELDWEDHVPPSWPAKALLWMTGARADAHLGQELKMRDPALRAELGL